MFRKAALSDFNKAVMEQDRELEELMRNHRNMYQPKYRSHHHSRHNYQSRKSSKSTLSDNSRSSEFVPDDDMSLTLVKLRIQQEKTNQLQKQYEQEVLRQQIQDQMQKGQHAQRMKMTYKAPETKAKKSNVIVIDVPCDTTLIIRSLPAYLPQKPSIMKLSSSNKLVQELKSLKPNKGPRYSTLTDNTTIVGDKFSKLSVKAPPNCFSKYSNYDSDISTLDDRYVPPSPSTSTDSSQYRKSYYSL